MFAAGEPGALAAALRRALATPPVELQQLARNALARVSGYTYGQTTAGLLQALASLPSA